MKKKIVILLSLVLSICYLLCACGQNKKEEVKKALLGEWSCTNTTETDVFAMDTTNIYSFDEDSVSFHQIFESKGTYSKTTETDPIKTKYSIKKDTIILEKAKGLGEVEFSYTYTDGKLHLFHKKGPGTSGDEYIKAVEQQGENTTQGITEEDIEQVAMLKVYNLLQSEYEFHCNPEKTTYSIGTIRQTDDDEYNVKGKLTLYDDYGNIAYFATFDVDVDVDSNGNLRAGFPEIELD